MGHGNSKAYIEAIKKLSSLELSNIVAVFNELSTENQDGTRAIPEPNMATRRVFADRFSLPGLIGERLFHAFDRDNSGAINLEEFVGGVALCLHGSAQAKCELLFKVFNFSDDDNAVTEDELKTILLSSLQSASVILDSVGEVEISDTENCTEISLMDTVAKIVQNAFKTSDKSKSGKLSAKEFSNWLHRNPQIMDNVFGWQCPKPELGKWTNETGQESSNALQDLFNGETASSGDAFFNALANKIDKNSGEKDQKKSTSSTSAPLSPKHEDETTDPFVSQHENLSTTASENKDVNTPSSVITKPRISESEEPFIELYDYYSSMWLPSKETISVLEGIRSGTLNPENMELHPIKVPSVQFTAPQNDPVKELLLKYPGDSKAAPRTVLTEDMVPTDTSGLKQLLKAECWRSALNLTVKLLEENSKDVFTYSQKIMEIWFCRIALLYELKMYSAADIELEAFGNFDSAMFFYEYYPQIYSTKQGSMVPFCFRILAAILPQYLERPKEALDKLFHVHNVCLHVLSDLSSRSCDSNSEEGKSLQKGRDLWKERLLKVLYCIGNTFLSQKEYGLAVSIFKQIAERDPRNVRAVLSGLGRISLQSGDIESAQEYFKRVEETGPDNDDVAKSEVHVNRGLLALTLDAYEESYKHFIAAKNLCPSNVVAINNAAVSLLFQGRRKEALQLLEGVVFENPEKHLLKGILFNIGKMYDLENSRNLHQKQKLLELIGQHRGDGFDVSCLNFP